MANELNPGLLVFIACSLFFCSDLYGQSGGVNNSELGAQVLRQLDELTAERKRVEKKINDKNASDLSSTMIRICGAYLDFLSRPDTAQRLATFQRRYYESLVEQGFTADQAFEIVRDAGNPLRFSELRAAVK